MPGKDVAMRFLMLITFLLLVPQFVAAEPTEKCNAYSGWERVAEMASSRIIMFGEMHGTNESPDAMASFLCELVKNGTPIKFGIEAAHNQGSALNEALTWPIEEQRLTDAAPQMWSVPDGRNSIAVLRLLKKLALWKASGANIEVFAFDSTFVGDDAGFSRSTVMAREVDTAAREFDGAVVVLTGGYHIRLNPPELQNSGGSLASEVRERPVLAMDMAHEGGTAFVTVSFGGGEPVTGESSFAKNHTEDRDMNSFRVSEIDGRKGYYFVGAITASPPAFPELIE